jgi:hypothetical protein
MANASVDRQKKLLTAVLTVSRGYGWEIMHGTGFILLFLFADNDFRYLNLNMGKRSFLYSYIYFTNIHTHAITYGDTFSQTHPSL